MKSIRDLFLKIENLKSKSKFDSIDSWLMSFDVSKISEVEMLSLLRGTFSVKNRLPSWYSFLDKVQNELARRKLDSTELLHGLTA